ncbi:MAG: tRNA (adenosine(37)-N6)-threonylcarbamoyltransferase complex transferase subunit TsaD [Deltaproteobacteria bacterium]|nr:tRNA (adenosine(37)-N6)-threonylcarbamoyltransferase complex transferase subunit TsaD [Deltaproteobacteria bacterium]
MKILGIETSCDETSAAVVEDGKKILSNVIASQVEIHNPFGGIVPELACRAHVKNLLPVVQEALDQAAIDLTDVEGIAVTAGPGLAGALLMGLTFAKSLAYSLSVPFTGVDHLEAHLMSAFLEHPEIPFPFLGLVVSGGHTNLYFVRGVGEYELLGKTLDDAAGEAFDKGAKAMGLRYPGGPLIDKLSQTGNRKAFRFPRGLSNQEGYHFSFSGLKTALNQCVSRFPQADLQPALPDIAASFQESIVEALTLKLWRAWEAFFAEAVVVAGGVACNRRLREEVSRGAMERNIAVFFPSPSLCSDNAAMIAALGYHSLVRGERSPLSLNPYATMVHKIHAPS